ncbi:SGNH/GDSL hydrolase family protein [Cryptosporangium sp. NPDC048952]|uniref:SGNH/GDSL hydrolase family protein n=1 Tax=Cryptosporangium sp. NPDC048952 TaxID=3363961 RepID=UPI00371E8FB9
MLASDLIHGALELERTERGLLPHRLPAWARAQAQDPQLDTVEAQPSGVRLVFRTRATSIELDAVRTRREFPGVPDRPAGVYDLLVDGELTAQGSVDGGDTVTVDMAAGTVTRQVGDPGTLSFTGLPDRDKHVEIWLPHYENTELVALRADAPVTAVDRGARRWWHHGSSISQGSNAASPSTTWVALAAAAAGVDVTNLGFGGSALLDPFIGRILRDSDADVISVEIGINLVNADLMRRRAFGPAVHGLLDTIRDGHPTTPIVLISPLYCPIHEETPGPGAFDVEALREGRVAFVATGEPGPDKLTLTLIRSELERIAAARADSGLRLVNGLDLYGEDDFAERPLPDGLHPDAATHRSIGERFAEVLPRK